MPPADNYEGRLFSFVVGLVKPTYFFFLSRGILRKIRGMSPLTTGEG